MHIADWPTAVQSLRWLVLCSAISETVSEPNAKPKFRTFLSPVFFFPSTTSPFCRVDIHRLPFTLHIFSVPRLLFFVFITAAQCLEECRYKKSQVRVSRLNLASPPTRLRRYHTQPWRLQSKRLQHRGCQRPRRQRREPKPEKRRAARPSNTLSGSEVAPAALRHVLHIHWTLVSNFNNLCRVS